METIPHFLHRKLDGYSIDEYLIMFVCASIFLPFYFSLIAIFFVIIYLAVSKKLMNILKSVPKSGYLLIFDVLTTIVAYLSGNMLGALCGIGIGLIFLFVLFYRAVITPRLFEFIIDACCLVSLFCFAWALMEYYSIVQSLDYNFLDFVIEDAPEYRVNSTFFNANYYAMAIEFLILMCVYKMMKMRSLHRIIYYVITIFCNLFALYLTGCRTAWVPFLLTIPLMFFLNRKSRYLAVTLGIIICCFIAMIVNPNLLPRGWNLLDYDIRVDIWSAAMRGIQNHPLFGQGPLTYHHSYLELGGPYTQHAHNVFLDPVLSHGIIPLSFFLIYMGSSAREMLQLYTRKINVRLFSLITAFVLTVLLHGLMDYTIFWVQTSLIFFIVWSAGSMYSNQNWNKTE